MGPEALNGIVAPVSAELNTPSVELGSPLEEKREVAGAVFGDVLEQVAATSNERINAAYEVGEAFAAGQVDDIHGTMIAMSTADVSLQMVGSVRNKVVDAFYELWRMSV